MNDKAKKGKKVQKKILEAKNNIFKWLNRNQEDIIKISYKIWEYSELGMQENKSSRILHKWLSQEGFSIKTGISSMPTAFLAEFSLGSGTPVIAFMAEYDALPGNSNKVLPRHEPIVEGGPGHGCGHNLIGTIGAAAAIGLKRVMERLGIDGTIRVYGTPGEELLIGKVFMARDGLFNDCDIILVSHPGDANAASVIPCYFFISTEITFFGESCHLTSMPEVGRNALDAALLTTIATNMRMKHMPRNTVIEYVIPDGGYQPNVVPDVSKVWYFIRHTDLKGLQEAYNKVKETVKGAAIATGTDSKEKFITGCYGYLPNERLGELIYDNAKRVGSPIYSVEEKRFANQLRKRYGLEEIGKPIHEGLEYLKGSMGLYSQDDGDASWITPLGKLRFAFPKGIPVHGWGYTAVSGHSIGYKGMMFAAKTLAATALDIFMVPELLKEIKKEHENRTKGFEYKSLVPKDAKPITGEFMKYHVKTRW